MLTDAKLKQALPREKPYKLYDGQGLYALVQPTGALWWRARYRFKGKDKSIAIGVYPTVSILEARRRRDDAYRLLAKGIDPAEDRREAKGKAAESRANTFMVIGEEWLATMTKSLDTETVSKYRWQLNTFLYPTLADIPVGDISTALLFKTIKAIEEKGMTPTAHHCRVRCAQIFRFARAKGIECISVSDDLKGGLVPVQTTHHAAITDPRELGKLLCAMDSYPGTPLVMGALKLAPMLFVRPYNLRTMEWGELSLDSAEWIIPAHKIKGPKKSLHKQDLIVPLARQAVEILKGLSKTAPGCPYVFYNARACVDPLSNAAITRVLEKIGYAERQSWHGFRATARTIIEEVLGYDPKYPEMQLAHKVKDANGRAYNRTAFLPQRREMMQRWADYLDEIRVSKSAIAA